MRWGRLTFPVVVAILAGCDSKELVVQSNTGWTGTITDIGTVSGTGNEVIDLSDAPTNVCWELRKTSSAGVLRAYLRDETWFGLGKEYDGDQTTSEPGGQIGGCNR
jgi:hypothetical protein